MAGDWELKVPTISRCRSTSSMFQAVSSSPKNEPKAKKQGQRLSYIPSHLLAGETAQHSQFSRSRSQSSPSAPLLHSSACQAEQSGIGSSHRVGARSLTMDDEAVPSAKRRLEINTKVLAQTGPAASRDRSLPESPGFPKMLATMTFPVPPTTSRPSTADACVSSTTRYQSSITSFPQVRPRSSSKRATSSKGKPVASLDELIAQQTSPHRHSDPGETSHSPSKREKLIINTSLTRNSRSATVGEAGSSISMGSLRPRASSAASSTPVSYDPRSSTGNDNGRQSFPFPGHAKLASNAVRDLVSMDEPYNLPIGIAISSPRDIASDMNQSCPDQEGESLQQDIHAVPTISLTLPSPYEKRNYNRQDLEPKTVQQGSDNETLPNKSTPTATNHVALDFDPTIIAPIPNIDDSKDSPILGRFLSSSPTTRRVRPRSLSRIHGEQLGSTKSGLAQTTQIGSVEKIQPALRTTLAGSSWKFSQVMTTEIIPEKPVDEVITMVTSNTIVMTPVMVVANLSPQPEAKVPTPFPTSNFPPLRPHFSKLKSMSQQRQKPVPIKVHNNAIASHGDHTRLFIDKLNRHTLAGVPTPPTSPSSVSPKRKSHPMEIMRRSQLRTAGKLFHTSEPTVHHQPNQDKRNDEAWRVTATKQRLEKAKLAGEEEISRLVERMMGAAKTKDADDEEIPDMQSGHTEEQIEKRLQRLEEDGDACLRDVKLALQSMSKTLEELRKESGNKKLIMNDFYM